MKTKIKQGETNMDKKVKCDCCGLTVPKTSPSYNETTILKESFQALTGVALKIKAERNDLLEILVKLTDQIDKHFYSLPEENENDGKYWKRIYDRACDVISQAEGK